MPSLRLRQTTILGPSLRRTQVTTRQLLTPWRRASATQYSRSLRSSQAMLRTSHCIASNAGKGRSMWKCTEKLKTADEAATLLSIR